MSNRFPFVLLRLLLWGVLLSAPLASAQEVSQRVVAIVPLGPVKQVYLERVAQEIQSRLNVQVRIEPQRELPQEAFYKPRKRWRAEKLLEALDAKPPAGAWRVVGVTEAEISTTKEDIVDWGIAGLASMGGPSCVLSSFIYQKHSKSQEVLLRRLGDLTVHEFGHTLGFDHCEQKGCVMSDAKGKAIKSADESSGQYCAHCLKLLSPEERAMLKSQP
ncbi:archaemetzincin [Hyalangium gracile]|uniref:archaemetzincin n=1 Tax=Hyalangium gracile TaxID=394092 RepID=UPI001CCBF85F|nr:archaemetzincin [Hyalangium gracile]